MQARRRSSRHQSARRPSGTWPSTSSSRPHHVRVLALEESRRCADTTVEPAFAITQDGTISLVIEGELRDEITHTMRLSLAEPAT
jgi:hypothetical protein